MSGWQQDPGYQFRLSQGLNSINAGGAAGGMRFSGATMKALEKYGQNFASNEYSNVYGRKQSELNNQYSRQSGLANIGVNAATGMGENAYQMGNAQAAGIIGQQNAQTQAVNNLSQIGTLAGMGAFNGGGYGNYGGYRGSQIPQTAQGMFNKNYGSSLAAMGL
jgi:hypothetical protein